MSRTVTPAEVKAMLADGGELALLDVREEGAHSQGHPFYSAPLPLSRLELLAPAMVPRRGTRIVLVDDGSDLAERAAARLAELGYGDVAIMAGGAPAWEAAGYVLFSGVHVPSKAFGEIVEEHYGTPHISAAELKRRIDDGEDLVIVDSRPMDEYAVMNIPGGIDMPGAELVHRIHAVAPEPEKLVVVNCAGRTRSILGAQSLINAGLPNRVVALENGTMGWHLAGFELERGQSREIAALPGDALEVARARARDVAARFGVRFIDRATMAAWQAEGESRTCYLLDVRSPAEYAAGRPVGALNAPGGQLVQETEMWAATLGARIILVDDNLVRATMTAHWLNQMGWRDCVVLESGLEGLEMTDAPPAPPREIASVAHDEIAPAELAALLERDEVLLLDFASSERHAEAHIPGAWFAIRARLPGTLPRLEARPLIVFTSPDGIVARLAAPEASELTATPIRVLAGGTEAWRAAGLPLEGGRDRMADTPDDVWLKPYQQEGGSLEERMQAYLTWELDLVNGIREDGDARFVLPEGIR